MNKKEAIEMLELTVGAYLLSGKADDTRCMQWREMLEAIEKDAEPVRRWIPVSERLPENRVSCIVCYREWLKYAKRYFYSIVIGWYARKHSVKEDVFYEWDADCDYDEDEDVLYIKEGWYEFTTQGNADLMNWYINAEVVAWMPLPDPYTEADDE